MVKGNVESKGNRAPKVHQRKLDDDLAIFIVGLVLEAPSLELCRKVKEVSGIDVCVSAICKLIHRQGRK